MGAEVEGPVRSDLGDRILTEAREQEGAGIRIDLSGLRNDFAQDALPPVNPVN